MHESVLTISFIYFKKLSAKIISFLQFKLLCVGKNVVAPVVSERRVRSAGMRPGSGTSKLGGGTSIFGSRTAARLSNCQEKANRASRRVWQIHLISLKFICFKTKKIILDSFISINLQFLSHHI